MTITRQFLIVHACSGVALLGALATNSPNLPGVAVVVMLANFTWTLHRVERGDE